jgi:hypothetical protein
MCFSVHLTFNQTYSICMKKAIFLVSLLSIFLVTCVTIDSIEQPDTIKAGSLLNSTVNVSIKATKDVYNTHFLLALLVPRAWSNAGNATITYHSSVGSGKMRPVSSAFPIAGNSNDTWQKAIMQEYSTMDNALHDMKWVIYETIEAYNIKNSEQINGKIYVRYKVGLVNAKVNLSYLVANTTSGFITGTMDHYSRQIMVTDGITPSVNYVDPQLLSIVPSKGNVNDEFTLTFNASDKHSISARQVYFSSIAYTKKHKKIELTDKGLTSRFIPIGNNLWRFTFYPYLYYGVGKSEQIDHITYYLTNEAGDVILKKNNGSPFTYHFN